MWTRLLLVHCYLLWLSYRHCRKIKLKSEDVLEVVKNQAVYYSVLLLLNFHCYVLQFQTPCCHCCLGAMFLCYT